MSLNPPLTNWRDKKVWIVGASSGIGLALAHRLHLSGAQVILSARRAELLKDWCASRQNTWFFPMDVLDFEDIKQKWQGLTQQHGLPDVVVYAAGHYLPMRANAWNLQEMVRHCEVNYLGCCRVLDMVLPAFMESGKGHFSIIASVAGYRGLPQALAYGPTKSGLISLAEILYQDLHPLGVGVSLINPGFVETPLTAQNNFRMPALITAEQAAQFILKDWSRGEFEIHFPKRFTLVMKLLRLLPYRLYFFLVRFATGA